MYKWVQAKDKNIFFKWNSNKVSITFVYTPYNNLAYRKETLFKLENKDIYVFFGKIHKSE